MDIRRYRNGKLQVRGNARRPFRNACRIKKLANSATVHYSLLPIRCPDSTPSVVLCYDVMGRQTRAVDAAGITTFAYDSFGSLTNETVVGVAGTNTIERFYDAFGRDAGYALNGVRQSTLAYDPTTGRLATMQAFPEEANHHSSTSTSHFNSFRWNYLPGSDLKQSLTYPNGLTASWTYGNRGELLEVNNASPTGTISKYAYTYDAVGRRIACAKSGTAFEQSDSVNYGYNARSELTSATAAVDSAYRYGYDFDDIGNRKTSAERGTNSVYTASQLNQYTAVDDFTPTYDADGNQTLVKTATGIWQVTYNGENRPVQWTQGDTVITMSFDRMGRRVTKNDQRFVYNGYLQIADNFGNAYVWDPTEPVATRPLVWNFSTVQPFNSSTFFYTHDGNKNVSEVIASNNDVAAHYEYAPFGALTVSRGAFAATNPWRFSSEYAEDDTVTVYYNYRHYEPVTGRWMARDPIEEKGGISLYCVVYNNLLSLYDYHGTLDSGLKDYAKRNFTTEVKAYVAIGAGLSVALIRESGLHCCVGGPRDGTEQEIVEWTLGGILNIGVGYGLQLDILGVGVDASITFASVEAELNAHVILDDCKDSNKYRVDLWHTKFNPGVKDASLGLGWLAGVKLSVAGWFEGLVGVEFDNKSFDFYGGIYFDYDFSVSGKFLWREYGGYGVDDLHNQGHQRVTLLEF